MKEYIRNASGKPMGSIETLPNGNTIVRSASGRYLGGYNKASDYTRNERGVVIARGNASSSLIEITN